MDLSRVSEAYFEVVSNNLKAMREVRNSMDDENSEYYKFFVLVSGVDGISVYKTLIDRDIDNLTKLVESMMKPEFDT